MMKLVVVHCGLIFEMATKDVNENTPFGESDQSEKSLTLGLKGFSLLHSSAESAPVQDSSHHRHQGCDDW